MTNEQKQRLAFLTTRLYELDLEIKAQEKRRAQTRQDFFSLANEVLIREGLAKDEEEASTLKFTFVNEALGKVFGRNIAIVGETFQTDQFVQAHPEIAERCVSSKVIYVLDEDRARDAIKTNPAWVSAFQDFTTQGKLQPRLAAVRKITEADLA